MLTVSAVLAELAAKCSAIMQMCQIWQGWQTLRTQNTPGKTASIQIGPLRFDRPGRVWYDDDVEKIRREERVWVRKRPPLPPPTSAAVAVRVRNIRYMYMIGRDGRVPKKEQH